MTDHENELDRLRRKNIELRQSNNIMANCIKNVISNLESPPKSTFQAQWVTEKAIQILRAAVERSENSTATDTAGSDYISKESVKPLVEALQQGFRDFDALITRGDFADDDTPHAKRTRDKLKSALDHAKSLGLPTATEGA